jgi:hypothetical protein
LVLALAARFCVFYPILLGWGIYLLDFLWDWGTMSRASVVEAELFKRGASSWVSSFHLAIQPANHTPVGAGQWLYLQCPAVDATSHPMSLCSASADDILHFPIGVRQPLSDATQTWTQQVAGRLRDHPLDTTAFRVVGPFGTTFNCGLTPTATAIIFVGAGSGMTAAESLLRELVQRRVARPTDAHPDVCFIWSVIDDVLWCWERLLSLLQETARAGALAVDMTVSGGANLDWFTSTIFVTQASTRDVSVLSRPLQREQHARYASLGAQPHGRSYAVLPASARSADDAINDCTQSPMFESLYGVDTFPRHSHREDDAKNQTGVPFSKQSGGAATDGGANAVTDPKPDADADTEANCDSVAEPDAETLDSPMNPTVSSTLNTTRFALCGSAV